MKNREIKFRAWDELSKTMRLFNWLCISRMAFGNLAVFNEQVKFPQLKLFSKSNFVFMQYTELKDKQGKEIYEGDIVKWSDGDYKCKSNPRIAVVEFSPELAFYAINCKDYKNTGKYGSKKGYGHKFGYSNFIYTDTEKHFDIIGNIIENSELLKTKN